MELRHLRYFIAVAEELNFTRAALRLHISQPPLSRQIQDLEEEVGTPLFIRDTKSLHLSSAGESLLKDARELLKNADLAIRRARCRMDQPNRLLRVGYLVSAGEVLISPVLASLRESHPDLKVKLYDMSPKEQLDALRVGEIDFAIAGQEASYARGDFKNQVLCSVGVCAAISMGDPLAARPNIALKNLKNHDLVAVDETEAPGRNQWMVSMCRGAGFEPRFIGFIDGITHVFSEVAASSAVTLLPGYFENSSHPGVTFLPVTNAVASWEMLLLWPKGEPRADVQALLAALTSSADRIPGYRPSLGGRDLVRA